ncbi:hypothetical protein Q4567_00210 [Aliiglaciecola sp. 2_MG-2023]|uniref:hypothetical protein n=1 Tax=unclassified Aliiglaciecola TaxID=2593648 RepID=UPI0026E204A0|nr:MULTISPECIES: hypothetical protein [unclassified Aliiglaciecola]MDO6709130.1 hypothetical protein [Aliiglaciecola sp. 2_MG-2023]MDO6750278.1 hypothetical protein [Aliiglaciecola sp. 1_MG-2023]
MTSDTSVAELHAQGQIDSVDSNSVNGWLYVNHEFFRPLVVVNGKAFFGNESSILRDDVNKFVNVEGHFGFSVPMSLSTLDSNNYVELYAITPLGVIDVYKSWHSLNLMTKANVSEILELTKRTPERPKLAAQIIDLDSATEREITTSKVNGSFLSNKLITFVIGDESNSLLAGFDDLAKTNLRFVNKEKWENFCFKLNAECVGFSTVKGIGSDSNELIDSLSINSHEAAIQNTLVLIWKMPDAGVYGRRIDQVARSYRRLYPNHRIFIVEVMTPALNQIYNENLSNKNSDASLILESFNAKQANCIVSGIEYLAIDAIDDRELESQLNTFIIEKEIKSDAAQIVFFPILPFWHIFLSSFGDYECYADIVDNELSWCRDDGLKIEYIAQYKALCLKSKTCFFNSKDNANSFIESGLCDSNKHLVIENWYTLPPDFKQKTKLRKNAKTKVFYSGNLNDRIDWRLLSTIIQSNIGFAEFSIVGNAAEVSDKIEQLLKFGNVKYWGPLTEMDCLKLMQNHDLAIVPHKVDSVSRYMNPLKVLMYEVMQLPTVVLTLPGVDMSGENIIRVTDESSFINAIKSFKQKKFLWFKSMFSEKKSANANENEQEYFSAFENLNHKNSH